MNFLNSRPTLLGLATAMIIAGTVSANAQQQQTVQQSGAIETAGPAQPAAAASSFSDAQIDAYARSALAITKIHNEMAPKIKAATSADEKDRMILEMQKQMAGAVGQTNGISVDEYNAISQQAQKSPQLAIRIRDEVLAKLQ